MLSTQIRALRPAVYCHRLRHTAASARPQACQHCRLPVITARPAWLLLPLPPQVAVRAVAAPDKPSATTGQPHGRVFNFSAGPAVLPVDVLEQAQADLLNWQGSGR